MGILNPAGALSLLAVAVLVALYLYDRRARVVPVAALFLWRQVRAPARARRRFRPDVLFLLQLALLLALAAGYLRPYVESPATVADGSSLVVVLDVSASMQAREETGTRFDLARRRARSLVAEHGAGDEVMLVSAGTRPRVVLGWTADRGAVEDRLEALAPLDAATPLAPALELALAQARARSGTRVAVVTDLPPEASDAPAETLAAVDWFQVGASDDNLAIASLTLEQPPFADPRDATIGAVVRNYGRRARAAVLEARVADVPWARFTLTLAPRATEQVLLTHPPRAGEVVVTLTAEDALTVDDHAVAWLAPAAPLDLLLVSDSRELAAAFGEIAAAIAGSRVEVVSPERYDEQPLAGGRTALFDGVVPAHTPPLVNALYVVPPPGNPICPSLRTREDVAVIDWEAEHPALGGMAALHALHVARASQLGVPEWGAPIVLAAAQRRAFPLLVAGERDGRRVACLGAALAAPLASSDNLPLLVLTLGTLRWLAEPFGETAIALETGVATLAPRGPLEPVVGPAGLTITGDPPVLLAERAGTYRVGPPGGERLVLANFFDDRESDIGRAAASERRTRAPLPAATAAVGRREIGWWLYATAALLLALEWLAWTRRARSAP